MADPVNISQNIVAPADIESELVKIWDSLREAKMRACLFNLIVFTRLSPRTDYLRSIVQKLIDKFPCRVLFVTHDADPHKNYMKTAVSVITPETESQIACEQIDIGVAGSNWERVPYVILPHILPDLPVTLLWGEDPAEAHPLFEPLAKLASRIIFDSESANSLLDFAKTLLAINEQKGHDIADLNWARPEGWRDILSSLFDDQQRHLELQQIKELKIIYNARETEFFCHLKIQPMYVLALLAARLGWVIKTAKIDRTTFRFTFEHGLIATIEPAIWQNLGPGAVIALDMTTERATHYNLFRIPKMPHHVSIQISNQEHCELPYQFVLGKTATGQSLVKEIFLKGTSSFFLQTLHQLILLDKGKLC